MNRLCKYCGVRPRGDLKTVILEVCSDYSPIRFSIPMALRFETYLLRRRTETQKYKGVDFEQVESSWA